MASYNRIVLMGNLTRDVELKYLPNGTACAELGLAVNEKIKKGTDYVDEACFVDLACFGRTAEIANEYLTKGSPVLIEGRLRFSSWEKDGQRRSKHTVTVDKLQMLGSKSDRQSQPESREAAAVGVGEESDPFDDDSIPF